MCGSETTTTTTMPTDPEPHESLLIYLDLTNHGVELFSRYLDVRGRPSRSFLQQLSFYATDEDHRRNFSTRAPNMLLCIMTTFEESRSYLEILHDFDSARPPLEVLLSIMPP